MILVANSTVGEPAAAIRIIYHIVSGVGLWYTVKIMKRNVGQMSQEKTSRTFAKGYLKPIIYIILLGVITLPLLILCVIYAQVIVLTTPGRNRNIGTIPDIGYEDVTLTTADGVTISGWYVAGTQPNAIVIVHGIHANRAYLIPQAIILAEAGYHLLLIDLHI